MKHYLVKLLTNTAGQDAPSIEVFPNQNAAYIAYHQILAAYRNAEDVLYAVVEIINEVGNTVIKEIVDHKPTPEPEPEPEEEDEPIEE